jgi:large subunit ribosomal protein L15
MITLHNLKVYKGSKKRRKVIGRGLGSGHGTYSTRGAKGQRARKSGNVRPGFEGGRQPLVRQVPKLRGFTSRHPKAITVTLASLNKFKDGDVVSAQALLDKHIIKELGKIKVLGTGAVSRKLEVHVPVSKSAQLAIEKAGGKVI